MEMHPVPVVTNIVSCGSIIVMAVNSSDNDLAAAASPESGPTVGRAAPTPSIPELPQIPIVLDIGGSKKFAMPRAFVCAAVVCTRPGMEPNEGAMLALSRLACDDGRAGMVELILCDYVPPSCCQVTRGP